MLKSWSAFRGDLKAAIFSSLVLFLYTPFSFAITVDGPGPAQSAGSQLNFEEPSPGKNCKLNGDGQPVCLYPLLADEIRDGDLIYGLQTARAETLTLLKREHPRKFYTIDVLNDWVFGWLREESGELKTDADGVSAILGRRLRQGELDAWGMARLIDYHHFLVKNLPVPLSGVSAGVPAEREGDFSHQMRIRDHFVSEACVRAIRFVQSQGRKIHFIIDQLEMGEVVNSQSPHFNSYTSQELRGVVRGFRDDPTLIDAIEFYRAGRKLDGSEKTRFLSELLLVGSVFFLW
jgi:hypothetical protein